ncbi:MAG TPA: hypothetical protein PK413_15745 [Thermoanaerobaculia bacterium]|nr:hypothetical protein [Thermoanaerobaculia bacterium]
MSRLEESRRRVAERISALGEETDRQTARALAVKDAAIAVLGAVGAFLAIRGLARSLGKKRKPPQKGPTDRRRERGRWPPDEGL